MRVTGLYEHPVSFYPMRQRASSWSSHLQAGSAQHDLAIVSVHRRACLEQVPRFHSAAHAPAASCSDGDVTPLFRDGM